MTALLNDILNVNWRSEQYIVYGIIAIIVIWIVMAIIFYSIGMRMHKIKQDALISKYSSLDMGDSGFMELRKFDSINTSMITSTSLLWPGVFVIGIMSLIRYSIKSLLKGQYE